MDIRIESLPLVKRHALTISRGTAASSNNLLVTVNDDGIIGFGEFSPVSQGRIPENAESARKQLMMLAPLLTDARPWEFQRVERAAAERGIGEAAFCALDLALHDWMGKKQGMPVYQMVGADITRIVPSSITIGINPPEVVRERVVELMARLAPRSLKIKLGSPEGTDYDCAIFSAVKETAPESVALRVDANGGWKTVETASQMMRWLAERGVEYIEQPLAKGQEEDLVPLYKNRPLPIYADESCRVAADVIRLADRVDGVNLKLMKAGGIREGLRVIHTARAHSLGVMMGCMSESELAIAGSVAISSFADYLDLDSHLNLLDPPFVGLRWQDGRVLPGDGNGLGVMRQSGEA
jgi:L-alanine-DL-glutamate epimerase-like enolase superfamily enzyme